MAAVQRQAAAAAACLLLLLLPPLVAAAAPSPQDEARVAALRSKVSTNPANADAWFELGLILHRLDHEAPDGGRRVPEAEAAYRQAAALADAAGTYPPGVLLIKAQLGALLLSSGRAEEASALLSSLLPLAAELGLGDEELTLGMLFNIAKAEQQLGREASAQELLRRVLAVAPAKKHAGAIYLKAWAALKGPTPAQLAEMQDVGRYLRRAAKGVDESSLSGARLSAWRDLRARWSWLDPLTDTDKSWLFFGLYSALDRAGKYDAAWKALAEGNRLQDEAAPHDPRPDEQSTEAVLSLFQPPKTFSNDPADQFYAALLAGGGGYRDPAGLRPIFVVGLPRSGSTLIEQILASHSQAWGAGEDTALAPLVPRLLEALRPGADGNVEGARIAAVGQAYVEEMRGRLPADKKEAKWIVDKMLRNVWNVGFISMMLPEACIIHAARNPADAGLSCFAQPFEGRGTPWAANLSLIGHQAELIERLSRHWEAALPGRVLRVRYEDLVRDQEATSRRMLAHCGLPWEPGVLAFHRTQRAVATASQAQVRQALYASSVGRFRRYAAHLAPLLRPLRSAIERYESEAGLPSSAALLAGVLAGGGGGPGDEGRGGGGSSAGGGSAGGGRRDELR